MHFIYQDHIPQNMASATKICKEFSDTTDTFRPNAHFSYHFKKGQCQYKLFLENQVREIVSMLQEGVPSKEKIEDMLKHFQREANHVIGELLTQTTQIRKKLRSQHDNYELVIRDQKCKIRKLAEENVYLTSELQMREKTLERMAQQLKNGKNGQCLQASRQLEGLQSLLEEYQKELEIKDKEICELRKESIQQASLYEECKSQIFNQTRETQELKETVEILKEQLMNQEMLLRAGGNHQMSLLIEHDEMFQEKINQKNHQIYLLASSENQLNMKVNGLLDLVEELKKQLSKEQEERVRCEEREKNNIRKFKTSSEKAILAIKEKYQSKIIKISDLLRKELRKARKQIQMLKVTILKELYSCLKETKGAIFSEFPLFNH